MCMNCLDDCRARRRSRYRTRPSAAGEHLLPDLARRGFMRLAVSGVLAAPILRLGGATGPNWNPGLIRPPGALRRGGLPGALHQVRPVHAGLPDERDPARRGSRPGSEGLWTPDAELPHRHQRLPAQLHRLRQRLPDGGHPAASAWTRSLGRSAFADRGPIRIGTAFVDRGRCLPWAMDRPCIVCQENCPVSPKAIFMREVFKPVRDERPADREKRGRRPLVAAPAIRSRPGRVGTGDYYVLLPGGRPAADHRQHGRALDLERPLPGPEACPPGSPVSVQVRLQQPVRGPEPLHRLRRLRARMPGAGPAGHPGDRRERVAEPAPPDGAVERKVR